MGAAESQPDDKYFGFRIYKLTEGGPLHKAGLKELEDFIVPPDEVFNEKIPFYDYVRNNANKELRFNIYSLSKRHFTMVKVTPNNEWSPNKDQGYLGASVRYENWATADKFLLRVTKVLENSAAKEKLGLTPLEDFIIALRREDEDIITLNKDNIDPLTAFSNLLGVYKGKNVEFFIYNCNRGSRNVKINIDFDTLGCDVAYGRLHEFHRLIQAKDAGNRQTNVEEERLDSVEQPVSADNLASTSDNNKDNSTDRDNSIDNADLNLDTNNKEENKIQNSEDSNSS